MLDLHTPPENVHRIIVQQYYSKLHHIDKKITIIYFHYYRNKKNLQINAIDDAFILQLHMKIEMYSISNLNIISRCTVV